MSARLLLLLIVVSISAADASAAAAAEPNCGDAQQQAADPACNRTALTQFEGQSTESTDAAPSAAASVSGVGSMTSYDPTSRVHVPPPSPGAAITDMPKVVSRIVTWTITSMFTLGVLLIGGKAWFNARIKRADEAATRAARELLRNTAVVASTPAPAAVAPRRVQWTRERIAALDAEQFALLCAGYWETRGYIAEVVSDGTNRDICIQLRRPSERRKTAGFVRCALPVDQEAAQELGIDIVREGVDEMRSAGASLGAIMTTGRFAADAQALAKDQALQLIDGRELLAQLCLLSQDQQEALLADVTSSAISHGHRALELSHI